MRVRPAKPSAERRLGAAPDEAFSDDGTLKNDDLTLER
jgi:hypothetical protein